MSINKSVITADSSLQPSAVSRGGIGRKSVVKSALLVGFATLCSRVLGFFRDMVIARLFGVYVYAQAFIIAFKIPNLFRDLLGEGAANAAFVPVFSEYIIKHNKEEFWELVNVALNFLLVILMVITVSGMVFSPLLVRLIAPGFTLDAHKFDTTVLLTRMLFPYCLLIALSAYAAAILNSLKHFSAPAFAPCFLNISIITLAMVFGQGIKGLSLGVLIGGLLQLAIQLPVLHKKGFRMNYFMKRFKHPAVKEIKRLMVPRIFSSAVYQLNNFVDSCFGSFVLIAGEGAVAGLYFAYRLIQFPLGIFSNALSQVILPAFSDYAVNDEKDKIKHMLSFGLRATFFVMLPASAAFMVLARPLITLLFGGGKFDGYSITMTSKTLFFYSIGLFAYGATKIMQSCFFSLRDTRTPTKIAALALIVNIVLNAILMFPMKLSGLALATSLSGINTFVILFLILRKKLYPFDIKPVVISFAKILGASVLMAVVCYGVCAKIVFGSGILSKVLDLTLVVMVGIISYGFFCFILKVQEMRQVWRVVMKYAKRR